MTAQDGARCRAAAPRKWIRSAPHGRPRLRPPLRAARARRAVPRVQRRARAARAKLQTQSRARPPRRDVRCSCSRIVVLGIAVPAVRDRDREDRNSIPRGGRQASSPPLQEHGRELFGQRCRNCHTLKAANATAKVGPNLDTPRRPRRSCSTRSRRAARAATATWPPRSSRARTPRPSRSSSRSPAAASSSAGGDGGGAGSRRRSPPPRTFTPALRAPGAASVPPERPQPCRADRCRAPVRRGESMKMPACRAFQTATMPGRIR